MTEIVRQRPSILTLVGELVSGRMPQHVWMNREGKLSGFACSLNHPQEPSGQHRRKVKPWCGLGSRLIAKIANAKRTQTGEGAAESRKNSFAKLEKK
jgi:hypothetical protein